MKSVQISIKSMLLLILFTGFAIGFVRNFQRMQSAEAEVKRLRRELGYLEPSLENEIAAVKVAVEEPLVWQARVKIPEGQRYRLAYSALWHQSKNQPDWFAAQPLPVGESLVTVRVMKDPRDDKWKISTIVRHEKGTGRIGTVLPDEVSQVFRGTHDVISTGLGTQTVVRPVGGRIRVFDERYFSGTGLMLFGDRPPDEDVVGIFAELQPDVGTL